MPWYSVVSNLCGIAGSALVAYSLFVAPDVKPRGVSDKDWRERLERLRNYAKEGLHTPTTVQLRPWRFRGGLSLVAISYLLPLAIAGIEAWF